MAQKRASYFATTMIILVAMSACGAEEKDPFDSRSSSDPNHQAISPCDGRPITRGIDVSKWQGDIDWPSVANDNVNFVFIRTSDGSTYTDEKFQTNWQGARDNGLLRGAYQYFRPREDPIAQAQHHVSIMGTLEDGDLPSVLDVEVTGDQSPHTIVERMKQWISYVSEATGLTPIIYTSPYFWRENIASDEFSDSLLWIAHYNVDCPNLPPPWEDWNFHQYSNEGSIAGIDGDVDLNVFNGTLAALGGITK